MRLIFIVFTVGVISILYGCGESDDPTYTESQYLNLDLNSDGTIDVFYEYDEKGSYELVDRNFDTKIDESHRYDLDSRIVKSKIDNDFDGVLETIIEYRNGSIFKVKVDTNRDFTVDTVYQYKDGTLISGEKYYEKGEHDEYARIGVVAFKFGYPVSPETVNKTSLNLEEFVNKHSGK